MTVPPELELKLVGLYARDAQGRDPGFDVAAFARAYAVMGAQRATKILGIFARLDRRDGKPQYLRHLPRIERYLLPQPRASRARGAKGWYETNLPSALPRTEEAACRVRSQPQPCDQLVIAPHDRHGARRRPRRAHAADHRRPSRSRWCGSAAER